MPKQDFDLFCKNSSLRETRYDKATNACKLERFIIEIKLSSVFDMFLCNLFHCGTEMRY